MTTTAETAPDGFRISTRVADFQPGRCRFSVRDDDPLRFQARMRGLLPGAGEAVPRPVEPRSRRIAFRHVERGARRLLRCEPGARFAFGDPDVPA